MHFKSVKGEVNYSLLRGIRADDPVSFHVAAYKDPDVKGHFLVKRLKKKKKIKIAIKTDEECEFGFGCKFSHGYFFPFSKKTIHHADISRAEILTNNYRLKKGTRVLVARAPRPSCHSIENLGSSQDQWISSKRHLKLFR